MNLTFLKSIFIACSLFFVSVPFYAQGGIKGRITDQKNLPVAFAVVYDETSLTGTTTNADGFYELKLDKGNHSLLIKAMGYYLIRQTVKVTTEMASVNYQMEEQPVAIKEIIVRPGKEDPAYAIMRKVIGLAPYHLNQVSKYDAEVYLRGTIHIEKMPKFISKHTEVVDNNGVSIKLKSGDVFLTESVNKIEFAAPDHYKQTVVSIRSTFPGNGNNIDPMEIINSSLYEPEVSEFISPLAPNAFHYYTYTYEGFFNEGKTVVFKIKVIPKRNSQQLVSGYLFIVDQLWCLHSADVSAEMFFGKLHYKTIYSPVKDDAWLPISYQFFVDAAMMGVRANYKYSSSVKFKQVELNENKRLKAKAMAHQPSLKEEPEVQKMTKNQQAIENIINKEDLSNRDMIKLAALMAKETNKDTAQKTLEINDKQNTTVTIEKEAVKNDTGYWNSIRPIPLTKIETALPKMKTDSLSRTPRKDTLSAKDTSAFKAKIEKAGNFLTRGAGFSMFHNALSVHYDGLIGLKKFDFNTVDGFLIRQMLSIDVKTDSGRFVKIKPGAAYAFSRQKVMWWTDITYDYAPLHNGKIQFYIGSRTADYNQESGLNSTVNSLTSLFFRRNYMKLFAEDKAFVQNTIDVFNGFTMQTQVGYYTAQPLRNYTDFSFFFKGERNYSVNLPASSLQSASRNIYHEEAYLDIHLQFTPRYYYKVVSGRKVYQHSKYPTFYLHNRTAVPGIANSTADYNLLELGARQKTEWGMMHAFSWNIKGGFFLNRNQIFTTDTKYFNNHDLPFILGNADEVFRLVPFYQHATTGSYGEAHMRFTTPYLLIKYLPFLSNKLWCENIHLDYLSSSVTQHYWEAGYSVSQIFFTCSAGIFAGFEKGIFKRAGIQFSIDL